VRTKWEQALGTPDAESKSLSSPLQKHNTAEKGKMRTNRSKLWLHPEQASQLDCHRVPWLHLHLPG